MAKYRDWLKAEQTNINPAGTPVIVRPSDTVGASYAALTMRNEQIRNTPETARGGYSALAPVETVSATVPKLAAANPYDEDFNAGATYGVLGATPDWAKRTPTEQARVNAAQARAQAGATTQGYAALAPATAPASVPTTGTAPSFANLDDASKAKLKQNNPALYNQLLVQGIISPLAEDQKQTATAPANEKKTATATTPSTVQNTDAGSPSTVKTEPTGYAKYLADHPELAEADRRAEAEYARSLPTYGALAEQMAQAGIHGGYSDYLQGVAYAKMQDAKQQNEEAARAGYAALTGNGGAVMSDTAKELYKNLLSEYGDQIAGITDETQYTQFEDLFRSANKGLYSDADVESALKQAREYRQTSLNNAKTNTQALVKQYGTGEKTSDDVLSAYGLSVVKGKDADGNEIEETDEEYEARKAESVRWVLSQAVKDGLIDNKELSATVKSKLAIYDADFGNKSWKAAGEDIYNSVSTAIDDKKDGILTDADLQTVLNDAIKAMGVSSVTLDASPAGGINADVVLELPGGVKLKADYNGKASETVANYLSSKYGNLPIVVYNDKLYYQNPIERSSDGTYKTEWCVLKTKAGSKGTPEQGDAYFRTVAKIMMVNNDQNAVEGLLKYVNSKTTNAKQTWNITTGKHEK